MTASNALDLINVILGVVFIAAMMAGLILQLGKTLRSLVRATRLTYLAIAAASTNLFVSVLDIPNDGVGRALMWAISAASAVIVAVSRRKLRDRKGDQVMQEAERTVREFRRGLS